MVDFLGFGILPCPLSMLYSEPKTAREHEPAEFSVKMKVTYTSGSVMRDTELTTST